MTEAGWDFIERSADEGVVNLMVPGDFRQAEVAVHGLGLRLAVYLPRTEAAPSEALASLMLRAGAWVRTVRPALGVSIDENPDGCAPRPCFERVLTAPVSADDVGRALDALAIAARWCVPEAETLQCDPSLAEAYLEAIGFENSTQTDRNQTNNPQNNPLDEVGP